MIRAAWHVFLLLLIAGLLSPVSQAAQDQITQDRATGFDADAALQRSQAVIGTTLTDLRFTDTQGATISLSDYRGKPLLISLIFTSCHLTCPVTIKHLKRAVTVARNSLGDGSFNVVTIGFDSLRDTPENMRIFASGQNINLDGWNFLSASQQVINQLTQQLGFTYFSSPRGFDHISQISIINRDGVIYQQVYGDSFELPWLVEPLKQLVFNLPSTDKYFLSDLVTKVKLFCTVYDPNTGRYRIDYSLFIQIFIGLMVIVSVAIYLLREAKHLKPDS